MHFVCGLSIKEIARRTGRDRNTVRRALRVDGAAEVSRAPAAVEAGSVQGGDPPAAREDPRLPGQRVRELIEPLGYPGGKTILDDYLREVRPLFAPPPRTFQRTVYRPGEVCQFDLWEPSRRGRGRASRAAPRLGGRRVSGLLARGRGRAGLLQGDAGPALGHRALSVVAGRAAGARWSGIARPASTAAADARRPSSPRSAASCGSAGGSASRPIRRPRASSSACRAIWRPTSSAAGRFANERDYQLQLDGWFDEGQRADAQDAALPARSTG